MKALLLFCFLCFAGTCLGQASYNFFHLSLDKGLSDARVFAIVQDRYGFMWFATPNGLNRYDGYSIKSYYASEHNGLPSNTITALHSSHSGDLWIGTSAGAVRFDFAKEKFIQFDTTQKEVAELARNTVTDFEEDNAGNIYAACAAGIFRYSSKGNKWEALNALLQPQGKLRRIRRLKFLSDEELYASTSGNIPMFRINIRKNSYDSIIININDTCCPNMYGIEKLNDQELLGGMLSNGIVKVNAKTKGYEFVPGVLSKNKDILYNTVYDILKDSRGRVWMASYYFRLVEYLPQENKVRTFEKDPYHPYGFDGNNALHVYEDRQHNIWVGTSGRGIYRFNPDHKAVRFYAGNDFLTGSLPRGNVMSLAVVDSATLMVGTENGPSFYNYNTEKFTNFKGLSTTGINGPLEYVQTAVADKNRRIVWMGTNRLGLMRYDKQTGQFRTFSRVTKPYPLQDDGITDILQLPDGNLFLIGFGNPGIFNTQTFEYISVRNDSVNPVFKLKTISTIGYDAQKDIWLATTDGKLYEYEIGSKKLTDRTALLSGVKKLKAIHKLFWQGGKLYLATNAGLVVHEANAKALIFSLNYTNNALNEVRGLLPDGDYVWLCNNRVVGRLHIPTGKMIFLGERDGLADVQLYGRTLTHSSKNTVLIGSNRGYYEIFPSALKDNQASAAPVLTAFRIYDTPLQTEEAVSGIKNLRLQYDQNFFSFDMSALDYEGGEDLEYAYMLEGFDKEWQYIGKQRTGSYTNVPGGDYVLRLKSKNNSGVWNEKKQPVHIHISKHFTATWWFWVSIVLLTAAGVHLLYQKRVRRIAKEERLRSDYEIKLNELENSALRTQMNPHFVFNSLNTINSFISRNETAAAHQYISKFSKLIRFILDHSRQRKILLSDELEVLNLYIQIERIRFENKFDYAIHVEEGIDTSTIELPPLIIQPFVENAILHGLLPLQEKGFLKIKVEHKNDVLLCTVEDTGIGREKAKAMKKSYLAKHKSHGIEITLKRIELFNREHGKEAQVQITDMPVGTRVEIPVAWEESF